MGINTEYEWDMSPDDPMLILIKHNGKIVVRIGVHEVVESSSRNEILKHIAECDRTPWLKRWQEEKNQVLIDALKQDYNG